ncbi:MAG: hypothetical protein AAFX02_04800 [Pseudomonadota bacterium]
MAAFMPFLLATGCDMGAPQANTSSETEPKASYQAPTDIVFQEIDREGLSERAVETLTEIQEIVETGSLRRLARYADTHSNFTSNFGTEAHYDYWYLLRRTGAEPLDQLIRIFNEPHGKLTIGDQSWHVWPDFAAIDEDNRNPDRMDINTRARLVALIGESGADQMRKGAAYPGVRTAISDDGRWIYWLFETGETLD